MSDAIRPQQFQDSDGVAHWRVVDGQATARFRTGSFAVGVKLIEAIGELADEANHHPDVDLRFAEVIVRLTSHDIDGLSERDVRLARQISIAADELDITADPEG